MRTSIQVEGKFSLVTHVAFGFLVKSSLHTWYVLKTISEVDFEIPSTPFDVGLSLWNGYVSTGLAGVSVF